MRITRSTGELAEGTVIELPDGEILEVFRYDEKAKVYRVFYLEFDGSEFARVEPLRIMYPHELIGGEIV